jgi:hypothetical protein
MWQRPCPNAMRFTGFGRVFKTVLEEGASVAQPFGGDCGEIAHNFVGDIFGKEQVGGAPAGNVRGVV